MEYAIETFDLVKTFVTKEGGRRREVRAVDHVDLKIRRGEFFGLLGPNGAGKTTLIKILCTIILPDSGTAKVNGYDILRESYQARCSFGWFHGETGGRSLYWRLNAEDNLRFYAYLQNVPRDVAERRIDALLEFFGLSEDRKKLVKEYSTGMKVRVMLARALLHNPPILFMDEPTIGLDTISAVETRKLLRALNEDLGKTIVFTSHNMFEVEQLCERVAIMRSGRIIADSSPEELREMLRDVKAVEVELRGDSDIARARDEIGKIPVVKKVLETRGNAHTTVIRLQVEDEYDAIPEIADRLRALGIKASAIRQAEPTFEDIFIKLAGQRE
ncbi:MAG: ABC transporter ATP-binding protein [Nitrososphaerota archaeon]|nr:ABC transporter ATP-binding protein [Candidatus Bathyarchaeota archaeon]MDW8048165.1 ABC transporter ATP-binding protein [Nitrososphaerota archaeon]